MHFLRNRTVEIGEILIYALTILIWRKNCSMFKADFLCVLKEILLEIGFIEEMRTT